MENVKDNRGRNQRCRGVTFHLAPESVWATAHATSTYLPEAFDRDGFVHCTDGESLVLDVANRYYRDDPRHYLLIEIDLSRVTASAFYEDEQRRYPHVFGPIDRAAVKGVRRVVRAEDGRFVSIADDHESVTIDD